MSLELLKVGESTITRTKNSEGRYVFVHYSNGENKGTSPSLDILLDKAQINFHIRAKIYEKYNHIIYLDYDQTGRTNYIVLNNEERIGESYEVEEALQIAHESIASELAKMQEESPCHNPTA